MAFPPTGRFPILAAPAARTVIEARRASMASTLFGSDLPADAAPPPESENLPEPPVPDGPGLFGDAPAAVTMPQPEPAPPPAPAPTAAPSSPYRVLARKYRPSTFAELIGQEAK